MDYLTPIAFVSFSKKGHFSSMSLSVIMAKRNCQSSVIYLTHIISKRTLKTPWLDVSCLID